MQTKVVPLGLCKLPSYSQPKLHRPVSLMVQLHFLHVFVLTILDAITNTYVQSPQLHHWREDAGTSSKIRIVSDSSKALVTSCHETSTMSGVTSLLG